MNRFVQQALAALATLTLVLPATAQQDTRRAGGMEPLDPEQMDAARVPLENPRDEDEDEQSREEWLEEQRRRLLDDPGYGDVREPRSRPESSSGEMTPFQENFRDALINQLENTAR